MEAKGREFESSCHIKCIISHDSPGSWWTKTTAPLHTKHAHTLIHIWSAWEHTTQWGKYTYIVKLVNAAIHRPQWCICLCVTRGTRRLVWWMHSWIIYNFIKGAGLLKPFTIKLPSLGQNSLQIRQREHMWASPRQSPVTGCCVCWGPLCPMFPPPPPQCWLSYGCGIMPALYSHVFLNRQLPKMYSHHFSLPSWLLKIHTILIIGLVTNLYFGSHWRDLYVRHGERKTSVSCPKN